VRTRQSKSMRRRRQRRRAKVLLVRNTVLTAKTTLKATQSTPGFGGPRFMTFASLVARMSTDNPQPVPGGQWPPTNGFPRRMVLGEPEWITAAAKRDSK